DQASVFFRDPLPADSTAGWEAPAHPDDVPAPHSIHPLIADLGGTILGSAPGHTIWLDNSAGWGWFLDRAPREDCAFTAPGDRGARHRVARLTVREHESGHLPGREHEADGLTAEPRTAGTRPDPSSGGVAALDRLLADGWSSPGVPFTLETILPALLDQN